MIPLITLQIPQIYTATNPIIPIKAPVPPPIAPSPTASRLTPAKINTKTPAAGKNIMETQKTVI